ncbi:MULTISPECIES: PH domain-containing protein [unclassified Leifsonia]|uniref:PH domain-containing protein n=1 Tax=unclassified Leifsonia TaxID=2663824 RepID=UPI0008A78E3D|nr:MULTISPECIES: PH domain-containing protein [unclassified Leifsonia]SEI14778.1 putative membrane protein [Leifsonia sp. CL154]SFM02705.1 putative membrane protein [Leifsonia sp. CL147]
MSAPEGRAQAGAGAPLSPAQRAAERYTDGEWHRLHPATPLLRGGIVFIALTGFVLSNLRERLIGFFVGAPDYGGDPLDAIYNHGWEGWALLGVAVVLLLCFGAFYLSWRMHTFRITGDAVEVRSGILFRTQRKARLDRIQGINVVRPVLARIFGAAKLDVSVAGHDANVQLAYLGSSLADGLRADVLRLASGVQAAEAAEAEAAEAAEAAAADGHAGGRDVGAAGASRTGAVTDLVGRRVNEFLAPELDPNAAPPASVVKIPPLRLLGSLLLSGFTVFVLVVVAFLVWGAASGALWLLIVVLPGLLGTASFYLNRFTKSLRYSIAGTPDGVRVGFGLLSTSNETLPPGRIHAVEVLQPLLWRPFGWWQIRIDTAGHSREKGAAGQPNTTMLPVGDAADVSRVLSLVLPGFATDEHRELIETAMVSSGRDAFTGSPRRAAWIRPLSWQRTGYRLVGDAILLRRGVVWRSLAIVPLARLQSLELSQGPVDALLALAKARFHTVSGPVHPRLAAIDAATGIRLFEAVSVRAVAAAVADASHRWGRAAAPTAAAPSAAAPTAVAPTAVAPAAAAPSAVAPSAPAASRPPLADARTEEES